MTANRLAARVFSAALAAASTPAFACVLAPSASADVVAGRVRNHQAELWTRSDVVFLSEANGFGRVDLGAVEGVSATLAPSLALKGEMPGDRIEIRHTTFTSCGPIPFLDALSGREGEWFVTYARRLPSGLSVDATIPIADLIDEETLRAWRKIDPS